MNSMILAYSGINIAINILLVLMVAVCLLLCLVVMMQRPKQEGLGAAFGGGMTDQAFGARTTDVLQKGTVYLGVLFFILTFTLSMLVSAQNSKSNDKTLLDEKKEEQVADASTQDEVNNATDKEPADEKKEEAPAAPAEEKKEATPATPVTPAEEATPAPPAETPATPAAPAETPAAPTDAPAPPAAAQLPAQESSVN